MPDTQGNWSGEATDTSLHAYKQGSGSGQAVRHEEDVQGDPTAQDVLNRPVEDRGDPDKHSPNR